MIVQKEIILPPYPRGFHIITETIIREAGELPGKGLMHIFIKHTSAGLTINENADPTVRIDFETVFNSLVPEGSGLYVHDDEGYDDMPAHIKASVTGFSVTIPINGKRLSLGTWQGIYLCEFRNRARSRKLLITVIGE
jgi:secondary thiamine-phosphate synthase enzyme